jgi:ribosome modulation factor
MARMKDLFMDQMEEAFEKGAKDAYYGRSSDLSGFNKEQMSAYMEGLQESPYGHCSDNDDYGDEE